MLQGDWVETHWSLRGIHGGELEGTAPTGKSVYVDGQLLSHIVNGKFVEEWVHWDTLGLLRQIGAVPRPHRDRGLAPRSSAASFRAAATGSPRAEGPSPRRQWPRGLILLGKQLISLHISACCINGARNDSTPISEIPAPKQP